MDGFGWHKARDLKIPENINIIYLTPYSPELKTIDILWLYELELDLLYRH